MCINTTECTLWVYEPVVLLEFGGVHVGASTWNTLWLHSWDDLLRRLWTEFLNKHRNNSFSHVITRTWNAGANGKRGLFLRMNWRLSSLTGSRWADVWWTCWRAALVVTARWPPPHPPDPAGSSTAAGSRLQKQETHQLISVCFYLLI